MSGDQTWKAVRPRGDGFPGFMKAVRMHCKRVGSSIGIALGWVLWLSSTAAQGEALLGQPFGVGSVTVAVPPGDATSLQAAAGFSIEERDGRTLYPVFASGAVRRFLGEILGVEPAPSSEVVTALFLFTGDEPLELTIGTPTTQQVRLTPLRPRNVRAYDRLLLRWWREFHARTRQQAEGGDFPPLVGTYLTSMLARRLQLESPLLSRLEDPPSSDTLQPWQLLGGAERLRAEEFQRSNRGGFGALEAASLPLPAPIAWSGPGELAVAPDVEIEPLAMRVPEECFYIRFGTFQNYLWLEHLQKDYGGDIRRMVAWHGYDPQLSQKTQRQLVLESNLLAEVLGPAIVADVALIGRDAFVREGPAVGMLFQARSPLFGSDLLRKRAAVLSAERDAGAREETIQIGQHPVSLLSTPDNRIRSYYVAHGDFHLITTSRAIVERFLEVSSGPDHGALGENIEFRHARSLLPTSRQDTIFMYFGAPFLQGLLSPQYQVELARRLRAATELETLQLARWAAEREGHADDSVESLIRAGFLPGGFGNRPDGSQPMIAGSSVMDSLRGTRGCFTPIPDVPIEAVTPGEAERLGAQAAAFGGVWNRWDPLMVGLKRFALDGASNERITVDAHISPLVQEKYGWLTSLLGAPTRMRIKPVPGNVIAAEAVLQGGQFAPDVLPHHLFLGVQDGPVHEGPPPRGWLGTLALVHTVPGYLGAWPGPGLLDRLPWLPGLRGGPPDADGYSQLPLGLWRRQWGDFHVLAFDPNLLAQVTPLLATEESQDEAQVRIEVSDLSETNLRGWVNTMAYARATQASLENARLLNTLSQQFAVPRPEALSAGEQLLDARLVCPLGGEYRFDEQTQRWFSTAWPDEDSGDAPAEYRAPLLEWFRGLAARAIVDEDRAVIHAELDLQRKPSESPAALPLFNLFRSKQAKEPQAKERSEPGPDGQAPDR